MGSALSYNEEKVKEGEAEVIAEVNVDEDHLSILDTFARLETMNIRSKDVSFHMSVNPAEGEKLSREQVKELVSDIMKGLGYEKQPYIIYRHDDIGRTHYHVVSIRTDRQGKKIPDRQERRNCVRILTGLEQKYGFKVGNGNAETLRDLGLSGRCFDASVGHVVLQMEAIAQECLGYRFTGVEQFQSLLREHGLGVSERTGFMCLQGLNDKGQPCTPKVDERSLSIPIKAVCDKRISECLKPDRAPVRQSEAVSRIVHACLPHAQNIEHFAAMLERKGITCSIKTDPAGKVTGVLFIDRPSRCVMNSSEIKGFRLSDINELKNNATLKENDSSKRNEQQQTKKSSASRKM
jgi:hypothetical protein